MPDSQSIMEPVVLLFRSLNNFVLSTLSQFTKICTQGLHKFVQWDFTIIGTHRIVQG